MHLETELMGTVRERAEDEAINVFARNLHDLLMAAPAGLRATMGLDPGLRTGVKVAVVDATGKLVATDTIYPHTGQAAKAAMTVAALCEKHNVELVAIGNGTASRETERFYLDVQKQFPKVTAQKVIVSEAGASVYSASELAAQEFPDLDVSLRGAVSIARRLQDPLAELVKIDPKSIGVGQYQHDVSQTQLARKLDAVVEDCVKRRWRRSQHCFCSAVDPRRRPDAHDGAEHRRLARREWSVPEPPAAAESEPSGAESLSSSARASCALTTVITRWTPLPFTRKPIRWWNAFWQQHSRH